MGGGSASPYCGVKQGVNAYCDNHNMNARMVGGGFIFMFSVTFLGQEIVQCKLIKIQLKVPTPTVPSLP